MAGAVSVYRNVMDGDEYALKEIDLTYLSPKDKKSAQNEVQFLRVLKGPTIVKFWESFVANNKIYIVMEYASQGALSSLISKKIQSGTHFSYEITMKYIAQITLAIMAMHTKNILHRDIKTQNIFITKNGVLKLGDFGISRELESKDAKAGTSCGTPLFMPPEVCLGYKYDHKADVWAVGVILYELICLRKPFESETINGVLQQIVKVEYEPLPDDTDPNITMLVSTLLKKDHNKRPSIFDFANIPSVRKELLKFINDEECQEEVIDIIDLINPQVVPQSLKMPNSDDEDSADLATREVPDYVVESLEEWAEIMRKDLTI